MAFLFKLYIVSQWSPERAKYNAVVDFETARRHQEAFLISEGLASCSLSDKISVLKVLENIRPVRSLDWRMENKENNTWASVVPVTVKCDTMPKTVYMVHLACCSSDKNVRDIILGVFADKESAKQVYEERKAEWRHKLDEDAVFTDSHFSGITTQKANEWNELRKKIECRIVELPVIF